VLQCVAVSLGLYDTHFECTPQVCSNVLPYVAVHCSVLLCVAVCCGVLQCVAVVSDSRITISNMIPISNVHLRCVAMCCRALPCVAVCCCVLQCVAVCCNQFPFEYTSQSCLISDFREVLL